MGDSFLVAGRRIFVAGHNGMVGAAIVRRLARENCTVLTAERNDVDLTKETQTSVWIETVRPDVVVLAAARVGGIHANNNTHPADFLCDSLVLVDVPLRKRSH